MTDLAETLKAYDDQLLAELEARVVAEKARRAVPPAPKFPIKRDLYRHGDKESNWSTAEEIGLSKEASRTFSYSAMEVELNVEVNEDGTGKILGINGTLLTSPVDL